MIDFHLNHYFFIYLIIYINEFSEICNKFRIINQENILC